MKTILTMQMKMKSKVLNLYFYIIIKLDIFNNRYDFNVYEYFVPISSNKTGINKLIGVLIANKTDLDDRRRRVSPKVGHELATQLGLVYFECSAKDFQGNQNINY